MFLYTTGAVSVRGNLFSGSTNVAIGQLDEIECSGGENNLFVCSNGTWGTQLCLSGAAGVACLQSGIIILCWFNVVYVHFTFMGVLNM